MSGFAGIVKFGAEAERSAIDVNRGARIAKEIAFRGPDGQMEWSHLGVEFWFSFLKTGSAPQTKSQPLSFDGRVWLLGDVRLDGREGVIRRIEQTGKKIESNTSDEALVLHVLHASGESGVAALDGDFSFVLWDERAKKLCGFRDLTGGKPFFYCESDGALSFSNTL